MALFAAAFCLLIAQRAEASVYTDTYIFYDEGCDCVYGYAEMYADYSYNDGNYYYPSLSATLSGPAGYVGGYDSGEGDTYLSVNYLNLYNVSSYEEGDYELDAESYMYYDGPSSPYDPYNLSYWMQFFIYAPEFFDFYNGPEATGQPVGDLGRVYSKKNVKFPKPVNFRIAGVDWAVDRSHLIFNYAWDSSTGRMSDLGRCTVDEYVTNLDTDHTVNGTYYAPSPPWPSGAHFPNPYDGDDFGMQLGGIQDQNGFEQANFVKPYSTAEIKDFQWIRWRCPYIQQGQIQIFPGAGAIDILTAIYPRNGGGWYYTVQKSGYESKIDPLP
jgi:hypothetical protein